MEAGVYVNSPDAERSRGTGTNTCPSGESGLTGKAGLSRIHIFSGRRLLPCQLETFAWDP